MWQQLSLQSIMADVNAKVDIGNMHILLFKFSRVCRKRYAHSRVTTISVVCVYFVYFSSPSVFFFLTNCHFAFFLLTKYHMAGSSLQWPVLAHPMRTHSARTQRSCVETHSHARGAPPPGRPPTHHNIFGATQRAATRLMPPVDPSPIY